jgi:hypothetical protein
MYQSNINWSDPNLYIILVGISILIIPLHRRELLVQKNSFKLILSISIAIFIIGVCLDIFNIDSKYWGFYSFYFPLFIVLFYRVLRIAFLIIMKREPIDTAFDLRGVTPWIDRIFNILYFTLAIIIPMLYLALRLKNTK